MSSPDESIVLAYLDACKACEYNELKARVFRHKITSNRLWITYNSLKQQRRADGQQIVIPSKFTLKTPPWFLYSLSVDSKDRQAAIDEKKLLLAKHYDNLKQIGDHGERLVKIACEDIGYKYVHQNKSVGNSDIDVYGKHPKKNYWQAISVKNWRDRIGIKEVREIKAIVKDAHSKWKTRIIRPAIVTTVAYQRLIHDAKVQGVPIALYKRQVAPEKYRTLCESLNEKLAFDFEITDKPPYTMRRNIEEYIYNT